MRHFFSTTLGQILAIIATSSVITFALFLTLLWALYPGVPRPPPWPWPHAYSIVSLVDTLHALPEGERPLAVAAAQRADMSLRLTQAPAPCETLTADTRDLEVVLLSQLSKIASYVTVRACASGDPERPIQALISLDDQLLDVRMQKASPDASFLTFPFVGAFLFLCVAVAAMSAWAVWRVIRPLRRLSAKVQVFGQNISITPIDEEGPLEIRRAARTFNLMQERITRSINDRTRMLAAISHDLRTPLTRMRLQLETDSEGGARDKLLRDILIMQSMVSSSLAFLSGSFDQEDREWLDLGALLSTLSDEYEERGIPVSYQGPEQIRFRCRPNAIMRAFANLVENGIRFGEAVLIAASVDETTIVIDVADNGPGIPRDRLHDVVEPFVRLDPSRFDIQGSVGLGLSIVKEIVEEHGGALELINGQPSGLIARIVFKVNYI